MGRTARFPRPESTALATQAIHGRSLGPRRGPVAPPIIQSSTYRFADSADAVRYARGDDSVYVYTRYHNPTVREVEERLALMVGAERALVFSSGMAAISAAVLAVARTGDTLISTPGLYGGTYRFFRDILPRYGIAVRYVSPANLAALPRLVDRSVRAVYLETPTNPTLDLVDLRAVVQATRRAEKKAGHRIVIMADNTFATVVNQNPLRFGVDVLLESCTKYLGGHSDLVGGMVAASEEFIRLAHTQLKYFGGCTDPFAAFLLARSLATFEVRVQRQNRNAMELAHFLERHGRVRRVLYPGLPSHPHHALARAQMRGSGGDGYGGMLTIEVPGGARGAVRVVDSLRVAVNAMSLGGVETLVSIPVYSSHVQMTREELRRHGVTPGMIRISVGLESVEDLKGDFDQALRRRTR